MCGCVQLTVDIIIVVQILMYRSNEGGDSKTYEKVNQEQSL